MDTHDSLRLLMLVGMSGLLLVWIVDFVMQLRHWRNFLSNEQAWKKLIFILAHLAGISVTVIGIIQISLEYHVR